MESVLLFEMILDHTDIINDWTIILYYGMYKVFCTKDLKKEDRAIPVNILAFANYFYDPCFITIEHNRKAVECIERRLRKQM